ncbi:hypothetical protein [Kibdelosporangium aridum]|uniref:hypothetical protein n=1 Tax=Kibdelosporangium aridum TaxID=2030 RepID=UPI0005623E14|nr:hypothetical protein [Kibdelosporangium aridum]
MTYPEPDPQRTSALPGQSGGQATPSAAQDARRAQRVRTVRMVRAAITFVCGLFAVVLAFQIILVLAEANPDNGFASFIDGFSGAVSLGFDGLFAPDSDKAAVLFNYGAAALVWLLIGAALNYLVRRFALPAPRTPQA